MGALASSAADGVGRRVPLQNREERVELPRLVPVDERVEEVIPDHVEDTRTRTRTRFSSTATSSVEEEEEVRVRVVGTGEGTGTRFLHEGDLVDGG